MLNSDAIHEFFHEYSNVCPLKDIRVFVVLFVDGLVYNLLLTNRIFTIFMVDSRVVTYPGDLR